MFSLATLSLAAALGAPNSNSSSAVEPPSGGDGGALEGHYRARIATFPDGTALTTYHLETGGERIQLDRVPSDVEAGSRIRVTGKASAEAFEVDTVSVLEPPPEPLRDATPREPRRIAFAMVHWGTPDDLTPEEARLRVFTGETSVNAYYTEVSYGIESVTGDVFGWYQIPDPGEGCKPDFMRDAALEAMREEGVDLSLYEQVMIYFASPVDECGWQGLAELGKADAPARDSWYNGNAGCVTLVQEVGHNYGMVHSKSYVCAEGSRRFVYGDDCDANEYGDPFDPMGQGCGHMNVYQKGYMGWIQECNTVTVTSDGRFNLLPTELPCNGTQSLRIPIGDVFYYLEYRQPLGLFDSKGSDWPNGMSGVQVRVAPEYDYSPGPYGAGDPYLLDMTPSTRTHDDAYMYAGDSYTDHQGRVTFRVVAEAESHAVIEVTFPDGGDGAGPTCPGGATPGQVADNIGIIDCAGGVAVDEVPPSVTITAPSDGAVFPVGSDFEITAEATDDVGVAEAELYVDGVPMQVDTGAPFSWSLVTVPEGTYTFSVAARDSLHETLSTPITVYVSDDPNPDGGDGDGDTSGGTGPGPDTDGGTGEGGGGSDSGDTAGADGAADGGCGCKASEPGRGSGWTLAVGLLALARGPRRSRRSRGAAVSPRFP